MARGDGGVRSYAHGGAKWVSRQRAANDMLRRTAGREQDDYWLYLVGAEDNDREVFIKKGVPRGNLLGIDYNPENIHAFRDRRNYGVCAPAEKVLNSWPMNRPVCAVMLDRCGGLDKGFMDSLMWLWSAPFNGCAVMVNLQRGNDPSGNELRESLRGRGLISPSNLHRGEMLMAVIAWAMVRSSLKDPSALDALGPSAFRELIDRFIKSLDPKYYSYRSGKSLRFDSVIFTNRPPPVASAAWPLILKHKRRHFSVKTKRKLAAQFAFRTMQRRGSFPLAAK